MERHCFMKVRILWLIAFLLFTVQLSAQQKVTESENLMVNRFSVVYRSTVCSTKSNSER